MTKNVQFCKNNSCIHSASIKLLQFTPEKVSEKEEVKAEVKRVIDPLIGYTWIKGD